MRKFSFVFLSVCCSLIYFTVTAQEEGIASVMIDAGHGGKDFGYTKDLLYEKDIALSLASKVADKLQDELPLLEVTRSRVSDEAVSISRRTEKLIDDKDLLVSLHTLKDDKKGTSGFKIFIGGESSASIEKLVSFENSSLSWGGEIDKADKPDIYAKYSQLAAMYVQEQLSKTTKLKDNKIAKGNFHILQSAPSPAILISVGYLSNKGDAEYLESMNDLNTIANAIVEGLVGYINKRGGVTTRPKEIQNSEVTGTTTNAVKSISANELVEALRNNRRINDNEKTIDEKPSEVDKLPLPNNTEQGEILATNVVGVASSSASVTESVVPEKGTDAYIIQVLATQKEITSITSSKMANLAKSHEPPWYKYYIAKTFNSREEAETYKVAEVDKDFKGAYIVRKKFSSMGEREAFSKGSIQTRESKYHIQVFAVSKRYNTSDQNILPFDLKEFQTLGLYKYVIDKSFNSYEDAKKYLTEEVDKYFPNAFVLNKLPNANGSPVKKAKVVAPKKQIAYYMVQVEANKEAQPISIFDPYNVVERYEPPYYKYFIDRKFSSRSEADEYKKTIQAVFPDAWLRGFEQ